VRLFSVSLDTTYHFTGLDHHNKALRRPSSPYPTHISILLFLIAHPLSSTCHTQNHSKYIFVP